MMEQFEAIKILSLAARKSNALVVSDIGSQTVWLHATGDRPEYLYLTGPMGMAAAVALGVALAVPARPVLAICGDGALAMSLNSLATIADCAPANLTIAVMDNGVYDFTGKARSPSQAISWDSVSAFFPRFAWAETLAPDSAIDLGPDRGLGMIHAIVRPASEAPPRFPLEPAMIHARFSRAAAEPAAPAQ
jgi:hypothetical protein